MSWWSFQPHVSVAEKRARALAEIQRLRNKGRDIAPVTIEGQKIARTFWGKAWCDNIESYRDFEYRLPRGRSYVRNQAVVDLQLAPGRINALVSGTELYKVQMHIDPLPADRWRHVRQRCIGQIGSLIELLQGRLSDRVMRIITDHEQGLFPAPAELSIKCDCVDWANLCKHAAAVLYGVGARLDAQPELLFTLRQADHLELITQAGDVPAATGPASPHPIIATQDVADVFGIDLETEADDAAPSETPAEAPSRTSRPTPKATPPTPTPTPTTTKPKKARKADPKPGRAAKPKAKAKAKPKAAAQKKKPASAKSAKASKGMKTSKTAKRPTRKASPRKKT